jgi:hypothetical protein
MKGNVNGEAFPRRWLSAGFKLYEVPPFIQNDRGFEVSPDWQRAWIESPAQSPLELYDRVSGEKVPLQKALATSNRTWPTEGQECPENAS